MHSTLITYEIQKKMCLILQIADITKVQTPIFFSQFSIAYSRITIVNLFLLTIIIMHINHHAHHAINHSDIWSCPSITMQMNVHHTIMPIEHSAETLIVLKKQKQDARLWGRAQGLSGKIGTGTRTKTETGKETKTGKWIDRDSWWVAPKWFYSVYPHPLDQGTQGMADGRVWLVKKVLWWCWFRQL